MKTTTEKTLLLGITAILLFSGAIVAADNCSPKVTLPSGYVTMLVVDGENSYFDMNISDVPTGYDITDGMYLGWCIQRGVRMPRGVNHAVILYSSYDPNMPESFRNDNWSKINYIINHKQNYSFNSMQNAIWYFIDDYDYPTDPDAQALIADANQNGEDFCPDAGDTIAILIDCVTTIQRSCLEFTIPETSGGEPPSGGGSPSNHAPTADAYYGEPYQGFVGEEITFDGSHSYDRDGSIVSWHWDFGDKTFGDGGIVTHIYTSPGTYNVTFTVTDDDGAIDSYETVANIAIGNQPPKAPVVNGTTIGTKNTYYIYTVVSTDPDDDMIKYVFGWDDGTNKTTTNLTESETIVNTSHNWTVAGVYRVEIYAQDENNATSNTTKLLVLIDVIVEFIDDEIKGYLIDYEKTGTFEVFYNNATNTEIVVEKQEDGSYLLDIDDDGVWDYSYDLTKGLKTLKDEEEDNKGIPGFEFILAICAISLLLFLIRRKN